jgi:Zn-finger protein
MAATSAFALSFTGTNVPGAGLVASKHNMLSYTETFKDTQGRVCAYCHTPHHALSDNTTEGYADYLPLWSHKITSQTNFKAYFTPTVGVDTNRALAGVTILCMSCHDGVVAVDEHYNNPGNSVKLADDGFGGTAVGLANNADAPGAANFGNDHPIGFSYDEALLKHPGDLRAKTTVWAGSGANTHVRTIGDGLTGGDFFTCASCHDVHNKDNVANSVNANVNYFLYADQKDSAFCVTCHVK